MNVNDMFPSKYLRGVDLKAPVTVTIASVKPEKIWKPGKGQVTGFVLYCEKATKGIVLNKTLAGQIAAALNEPDTDAWPGKQITLYPESVNVGGEVRPAVRARAANGNGA